MFTILYRPFAAASTGRAMAMLSYVSDSATHLYLVQDIRQYGGYINLRAPVDGWSGMTDYPAAWAGNVALTVQLLLGDERAIAPFIRLVVLLIIGCYALLVFFAALVVFDIVCALTGRIRWTDGILVCVCLGLTTVLGVNVFLLQGGFYTQMLATTSVLASIALMNERSLVAPRALICLSIFTVALMQTWYLLAPVLGGVLLVYVATAKPAKSWILTAAVPVGLLSAYPVLTGPTGSHINAVGPSPLPTIVGIVGLLLVTLVGIICVLRAGGRGHAQRLGLVAALVGALLLVIGILVLQGSTTSGFNYYAFKIFYTIFLLGTVAGSAAAAVALSGLHDDDVSRPSRWQPGLVVLIVLLGLSLGAYATRTLSIPYAMGDTPTLANGRSLDALFRAHPAGLPKGTDAWMLDGCQRVSDHLASKWAYDLSLSWDTALNETYLAFAGGTNPVDVGVLLNRAADPVVMRMEIYVHKDCAPEAREALRYLPGVFVIMVD